MKTTAVLVLMAQCAGGAVIHTTWNRTTVFNTTETYGTEWFSPRDTATPEFLMVFGQTLYLGYSTPSAFASVNLYTGSVGCYGYGEEWDYASFRYPTYGGKFTGVWCPGTEGYVAVAIRDDPMLKEAHNGWVHIRWNDDTTVTFIDGGFETVPDRAILIGVVPEQRPWLPSAILASWAICRRRRA